MDWDGEGPEPVEKTLFVYDRDNTWADFSETGVFLARYLYGPKIDELLAHFRPTDGIAWYLTDHLGTVCDLISPAGALINHIAYNSFGGIFLQTNPITGDRFLFTGREWDLELRLYYFRARFFDPSLGRFTSYDPLGFTGGDLNLNRYIFNNPINFRDPTGKGFIGAAWLYSRQIAQRTYYYFGLLGICVTRILFYLSERFQPVMSAIGQIGRLVFGSGRATIYGLVFVYCVFTTSPL